MLDASVSVEYEPVLNSEREQGRNNNKHITTCFWSVYVKPSHHKPVGKDQLECNNYERARERERVRKKKNTDIIIHDVEAIKNGHNRWIDLVETF